jgi:ELWxxDGT repeat protein
MQKATLASLLVFTYLCSMQAQVPFCDTKTDQAFLQHFDQLLQQSAYTRDKQRSVPLIQVPLVFHIEEQGGSPVIELNYLLNKLALVNTYFAPGDVEFTNCAPVIYYEGSSGPAIAKSINVFLYAGSSGCGVYSGSISINVSCNRTLEHILAHELGHALGLPHTHGYTNTGTTTELVDGSNCTTNGDRFCDTPADPNLLSLVNGSCQYTGTGVDANGDMYMPDVTNIMSYARSTCVDKFSLEQLDKMYLVAESLNFSCCRIDPPSVANAVICSGQPTTLTATTNLPQGIIKWYSDPKGGVAIFSGPNYTTDTLYTTTAFYVEVQDSCISERATVIVTVNPAGGLQLLDASIFAKLGPGGAQNGGSNPYHLTKLADTALVFIANRNKLYATTSLMDTVLLLTDTFSTSTSINISGIASLGETLIVAVNNFDVGPSLWSVEFSTGAATRIKSFGTNYGYSNYWLTKVGDLIYGQLNNETLNPGNGYAELWKTDGTVAGTELVKDLAPTGPFGSFQFTPYQGKLIFVNSTLAEGEELWISAGSIGTTTMIKDINPGAGGSQISSIVESDGLLYFSADDSIHGQELWVSDGTSARTNLLLDIHPGISGSSIYSLAAINGYLYFSADDGVHGSEPFRSDGTPEGTQIFADVSPTGGSSPANYTFYNNEIYFTANKSTYDYELFKEDLVSVSGAALIREINPTGSANPSGLFVHDNLLFFTAFDGQQGTELWQTDGSLSGTQIVLDINPNSASSYPGQFCRLGDRLFFTADDGEGQELWHLDVPKFETCYGGAVLVRTKMTSNTIEWYDASVGGQLLGTGEELSIANVTQAKKIYAEISDGNCTSVRYPVTLSIKSNCPCLGPAELTLDQTYTDLDHFSLHAIDRILTPSLFLPGSDMQYKAPSSITLLNGFEVQFGGQFQAVIEDCEE